MNGITVPDHLKASLMKPKDRRPEYREALVRDYVQAHPNEILKYSDFGRVAYNSNTAGAATALIKKLRKQGRLTRHKVVNGKRGVSYRYEWHNQRQIPSPTLDHPIVGEVKTRPMTNDEREAVSSTLNMVDGITLKIVTAVAKEFAWCKESDSLREFIKHIGGK